MQSATIQRLLRYTHSSPTAMPKLKPQLYPKYCRHPHRDLACVHLNGKRVMLGKFNSPESHRAYALLIKEWEANDRRLPTQLPPSPAPQPGTPAEPDGITVAVVLGEFWKHAQDWYQDKRELAGYGIVIRHVLRLYGDLPADRFGPNALRDWREAMILDFNYVHPITGEALKHEAWSRQHANKQTSRLKHIFKWAVSREHIPPSIYQALITVDPLRFSHSNARETEPVKPVDEGHVREILPFLSRQVRAIIEFELITGARGGELLIMRSIDIDMSKEVWVYTPRTHKNTHRGKDHKRTIHLGKLSQEVIRPFLKTNPQAYLFSPADSEAERRAANHAARKTRPTYGNTPGSNKSSTPKCTAGEHYTSDSYRQAVQLACHAAFAPPPELARQYVIGRRGKKGTRRETIQEWKTRLGTEAWGRLEKWIKEHRFHPHQIPYGRHPAP